MAIAGVGQLGVGSNGTAAATMTLTTTAAVDASSNHFALLVISKDNISTSDGATAESTSVTGGAGTWTKLDEYTNANGVAAAGATVAVWLFVPSGANAIGTVFTMGFSAGTVQDKCCTGYVFTKGSGATIRIDPTSTTVAGGGDGISNFTSASHSGLSNKERLWFRGLAKERNALQTMVPTTGYTALTGVRSRSNVSANMAQGEFIISTATGATSDPSASLVGAGDTAELFFALEEYTSGGGTGYTLTVTSGAFALAGTAAGFKAGRRMVAATRAHTLTGKAVGLKVGRKLAAASAAFILTGKAAAFARGRRLVAATGTFALSGAPAGFRVAFTMQAIAGSFTLGGGAVNFNWSGAAVPVPGFSGGAASARSATGQRGARVTVTFDAPRSGSSSRGSRNGNLSRR